MKGLLSISANVLVVDDDPILLEEIQKGLESSFSSVISACDGREAIQVLKTQPVDVVVTDYMMPKMNGVQLIAYVKAHYPLIPVIMLTANGADKAIRTALAEGVFDVLNKPFRAEILINRVQNSLLLPHLVEVIWACLSKEWDTPRIEDFLKMTFQKQIETLHAFSALLKTRGLSTNASKDSSEAA